jgi:hypothetical protein
MGALTDFLNDIPVVGELIPDKPTNLGDTKAGKKANTFGDSLMDKASTATTPTPGTAPQVGLGGDPNAVARAQAAYDEAMRQLAAAQTAFNAANSGAVKAGPMSAGSSNPDPTSSARYQAAKAAADQAKAVLDQAKAQTAGAQQTLNTQQNQVGTAYLSGGASAQGTSAQGAAPVNATTVTASPLNFATSLVQQAQQNQIGQQGPIQVQHVDMPTGVTAQQFSAPTIAAAPMVTAERIGEMRVEGAPGDISLDGTVGRNAQLEALGLYRGVLDGSAPSAAEQLQRKGVDESIGAAYGLAASLQGRNAGLALSTGVDAAGQAIARSAADTAALRAQEMETARAGLAALGSKISDQDFQIAATNQTKNLTVAVTNLEAKIKTAIANQDAALRAGLGNQAAAVQTNIAQMQAQLETLKANASNALTADIATMTAKLDASKADAANVLAARIQDSQANMQRLTANQRTLLEAGINDQANALTAEIERVRSQLDADKSNQQALLDAAKTTATLFQNNTQFNASLGQQNNQFNASLGQQNDQFNANQRQDIVTGNADRAMMQQTINNALYNSIINGGLSGAGLTTSITAGDLARQQQYEQQLTQMYQSWAKAGATALAGVPPVPTPTPVAAPAQGPTSRDSLIAPTTLY